MPDAETPHAIENYVLSSLNDPENNVVSAEDLLQRLQCQYMAAFVESNRSYYISIIFAGLYAAKRYGIDLKFIFMEQTLIEIPNAEFFFAIGSIGALGYAAIRACDSGVYERIISATCSSFYGKSGNLISRSYVGGGAILHNIVDFESMGVEYSRYPRFTKLSMLIFMLILFFVSITPLLIGIDYAFRNPFGQSLSSDAQTGSVIFATLIALLVSITALNVNEHEKIK